MVDIPFARALRQVGLHAPIERFERPQTAAKVLRISAERDVEKPRRARRDQ
jgi:hypothetical protein